MRFPGRRVRRAARAVAPVLCVLAAASALAAETPEPVQLRAAVHPKFGRLVLEWREPVSVERHRDPRRLVLRFDRPFAADLGLARGILGQFLSSLRREDGGRALSIGLRPGTTLARFRQFEPELVVLDFMDEDAVPEALPGEVSVRTGEHEAYRRLVLDFAAPVVHRLERDGDRHVLTFDQAVAIDARDLGRRLRPLVEDFAAHQGGRPGLTFRVGPGVDAEVFALDEDKIVIDLRTGTAAGDRPSAPPQADAARSEGRVEQPGRSEQPEAANSEVAPAATGPPAETDVPTLLNAAPPSWPADRSRVAVPRSPAARLPLSAPSTTGGSSGGAEGGHRSEPEQAVRAASPRGLPTDRGVQRSAPEPAAPVDRTATADPEDFDGPRLAFARTPRGVELSAVWPEPVPAAVFSRAGVLWAVFDAGAVAKDRIDVAPPDPGLQAVIGAPELYRPGEGLVVLRWPLRADLVPQVEVEGETWRLLLRPERRPAAPIEIVRLREPKRLRIEEAGGRAIRTTDPLVGDQLVIWPLLEPGQGVDRRRSLVQLELLPTAQGVVVREIADGVEVAAQADALEITAGGGLHLSLPAGWQANDQPVAAAREGRRRTDQTDAQASNLPEANAAPAEGWPDQPGAGERAEDVPLPSGRASRSGPDLLVGMGSAEPSPVENRVDTRSPAPPEMDPPSESAPLQAREPAPGLPVREAGPVRDEGRAAKRRFPEEAQPPRVEPGQAVLGLAAFALAEGDSMHSRRTRLLRRLQEAEDSLKDQARLDLARFFLAQAMAAEALSVLNEIAPRARGSEPPELARRALTGAAELLMGRVHVADRALQAPGLDRDPEVSLWRAALAAAKTDWDRAALELERSADTLAGYPPSLRFRLGVPAAMIAAEAAGPERTLQLLNQIGARNLHPRDRAQLDFIRGLAHVKAGAVEEAVRIWRDVAAGTDQESRIKAQYALADLLFQERRITAEQALAQLLPARPLWRGHVWEAGMLDGLAEIQQAGGDPAAAVRTWQELRRLHPGAAEQLALGGKIEPAFAAALAGPDPASDPLASLRALALYRDHPDLLPGGSTGHALRRALAERLAALDLLDPAAALLREVLGELPGGADAARDGARLASLELREPDPETALEVLDATAAANLPADVSAERLTLRARALDAIGRGHAALELLSGRGDPTSRALRNDILWRQRDWRRLARSLEATLAEADAPGSGLSLQQQTAVLRLAIAHGRLGGDGLERVRQRFGPAMRGSPAEPAFLMATRAERRRTDADAVLAAAERQVQDIRAYLEPTGSR